MAQEYAKSFYTSKKWLRCRTGYIENRILIDGGMCEECHKQLGYIVHHKIMLTKENIVNPEIALNWNNLEFVCKECHDKFEGHGVGKRNKSKTLCIFDKDGQPISMREIDSTAQPPLFRR